jgi:hypothetical protein
MGDQEIGHGGITASVGFIKIGPSAKALVNIPLIGVILIVSKVPTRRVFLKRALEKPILRAAFVHQEIKRRSAAWAWAEY